MRDVSAFKTFVVAGLFFVVLLGAAQSLAAPSPELTRSQSGGGVMVNVTYVKPEGVEETRFQVVLDTHSVNLDGYDLKALTLLRDEAGKTYEPTKLENKGSGHHREIVVVFSKPSTDTKQLELIIKDIAGVKERTFRWDLK